MQQPKQLFLISIVLFVWVSVFYQLWAQEIQPHNVIVQSSFNKDSEVRPFTDHSFKILESTEFHEPYYPPFQIVTVKFDEEASLNIPLSGLTKSLGGFSEIVLKEKGILENAFLLYKSKKYDKAEAKLLSMLPFHGDIGEKATLLLAWTKYHKHQPDVALSYAKAGFQAMHPSVALESFYLASLIWMNSHDWEEIVDIYQQHSHSRGELFWDARFSLIQVIALSSLKRWQAVNNFIQKSKIDRYAHSKFYYKFYELAAISFFKRRQFKDSLKSSKSAYDLNPDLKYRTKLNRIIAWQYYFSGQYSQAVELIKNALPLSQIEYSDEIKYLILACHIKLKQEPQAKIVFKTITTKSIFYKYAAFLIQTESERLKNDFEIVNILKNIRYDFPEMTFKSALQKGNSAFESAQYEKAERHYLQALSADVGSNDYMLAQYNLGLTHLKLLEFEKARLGFEALAHSIPTQEIDILNYHLLFALNGLKQKQAFLDRFKKVDLTRLSNKQSYELQFMEGNMLLAKGSFKEANAIFFTLWQITGKIEAFESCIIALYRDQNYISVLELLKKTPSLKSKTLFALEIRSLLAIKKSSQALAKLNDAKFKNDEVTELKVEVWMANQLYRKTIKHVTQKLSQTLESDKRLLFYLSLGDAYYYLKQYSSSKNQFYKALSITDNPLKKSLIQYNIALVAYYSKDFQSFVKETKMILAKSELLPEIRYNLTQLLVDYYQQNKQHQKADEVLVSYIAQHSYRRASARFKRIQLFHQNSLYGQCFELAKSDNTGEDAKQRTNRLVLYGYCGNETNNESAVIDTFSEELSNPKDTYRNDEMELIVAQAYFQLGQYEKSKQITEKLKTSGLDLETALKNRMLLINSLVKLKAFETADQELGDPNQYRQTPHYPAALNLKAEIDAVQGKVDDSIKALLRIYYLPATNSENKLKSLIRVCEILVQRDQQKEARKYWQLINNQTISKDSEIFQRYQALENSLKQATP